MFWIKKCEVDANTQLNIILFFPEADPQKQILTHISKTAQSLHVATSQNNFFIVCKYMGF